MNLKKFNKSTFEDGVRNRIRGAEPKSAEELEELYRIMKQSIKDMVIEYAWCKNDIDDEKFKDIFEG